MTARDVPRQAARSPLLSCYTTALVSHLRMADAGASAAFASAVELAVRTDLSGGMLAFRQHRRVDGGLGYETARTWAQALPAIRAELHRRGDVITVASARNLPWSPSYGKADMPHWIRLAGHDSRGWLVIDKFDALLPGGRQHQYSALLSCEELRLILTPLPAGLPPEVAQRDIHALGEAIRVPGEPGYRWLSDRADGSGVAGGQWIHGTVRSLGYLASRFAEDPAAMRRHAEDIWAASRHHQYASASERVSAAWRELPVTLRFAAKSEVRGRPRPTLVVRAFEHVIAAMTDAGELR
jgi:hypothetical protein